MLCARLTKKTGWGMGLYLLLIVMLLEISGLAVGGLQAAEINNGAADPTIKIVPIDAGTYYSLILKAGGTVWAYGKNDYGQLGDGTTTNRNTPVQVQGLSGVKAVAGGFSHSLALKSDGTVWAWGNNHSSMLGDGSTDQFKTTPVEVKGLSGVEAIAAGNLFSLALKTDGTVWAWGCDTVGQLGTGTFGFTQTSPVQVQGLTEVKTITTCNSHSLALKSDGTVWAWGDNFNGQLGDGTKVNKTSPVQVQGLTGVKAVSAGFTHSLALKSDGTVWAWGDNVWGALGDGTQEERTTPVQVQGLTGMRAVAAGWLFSLALRSDGTVWAWGDNSTGHLGIGNTPMTQTTPIQVPGLNGMRAITAGGWHSQVLKSDGTIWTWGCNSDGQLGDGTDESKYTPVQVNDLGNGVYLDNILVDTITVTPDTLELYAGGSGSQLTVDVLPNYASNINVSWSSDNTDAATVDNKGYVTPVAEGDAIITATAADGSGVSDTCTVSVKDIPALTSFEVGGKDCLALDSEVSIGDKYTDEQYIKQQMLLTTTGEILEVGDFSDFAGVTAVSSNPDYQPVIKLYRNGVEQTVNNWSTVTLQTNDIVAAWAVNPLVGGTFYKVRLATVNENGPDLVVDSIELPSTELKAGSKISFNAQIRNCGWENAGLFKVKFYLSSEDEDGKLTEIPGSSVIKSISSLKGTSALKDGSKKPLNVKVLKVKMTIPNSITPGHYIFVAEADPDNAVIEPYETLDANRYTESVSVLSPELSISIEGSVPPCKPGKTAALNLKLVNSSQVTAGKFTVKVFLSNDANYSGDDTLLCTKKMSKLVSTPGQVLKLKPKVPKTQSPGQYTLFAVINADNTVGEADETNNIASATLTVN